MIRGLASALSLLLAMTACAMPRGYSVPIVDLSTLASHHVTVDREAGQYLGHPNSVLLEDGTTILVVYPKNHGGGALVLKRSTDGGITWSARLPTPDSWAGSRAAPSLFRVVDAVGMRRLIVFSGGHPIRMSVSEDDGATWTELKSIGDFGGIMTMASVELLASGDYMALFHDDGRFITGRGKRSLRSRFRIYKTLSSDGGMTWSDPEVIAKPWDAHLCEPGLIRSPDGRRLATLLRENSRTRNSFVIFSDDEGATWSRPTELPGALTGDRHQARYAPDGRLFIAFRDTTLRSPTHGDWCGWVGTWQDIVEGREGEYRVRLKQNHYADDCGYSGLEVLPDGTFVAVSYGHWTPGEEPYIACVRFTIDDLDAVAASQR